MDARASPGGALAQTPHGPFDRSGGEPGAKSLAHGVGVRLRASTKRPSSQLLACRRNHLNPELSQPLEHRDNRLAHIRPAVVTDQASPALGGMERGHPHCEAAWSKPPYHCRPIHAGGWRA